MLRQGPQPWGVFQSVEDIGFVWWFESSIGRLRDDESTCFESSGEGFSSGDWFGGSNHPVVDWEIMIQPVLNHLARDSLLVVRLVVRTIQWSIVLV